MPECIIKLGLDVKEVELLKICVGSFIILAELRSCHIDLTRFKNCYIVLVPALHSRNKIT